MSSLSFDGSIISLWKEKNSEFKIWSPTLMYTGLYMLFLANENKDQLEVLRKLLNLNENSNIYKFIGEIEKLFENLKKEEDSMTIENKYKYNSSLKLLPSFESCLKNIASIQQENESFNCEVKIFFQLFFSFYFNGKWTIPFHRHLSKVGTFYIDENTSKEVSYMCKYNGIFNYHEGNNHQIIELPYQTLDYFNWRRPFNIILTMGLILDKQSKYNPTIPNNIYDLFKNPVFEGDCLLNGDYSRFQEVDIEVLRFPKFKIDDEKCTNDLFLSKMLNLNDINIENMINGVTSCVLNIIAKNGINVNEEGTQAYSSFGIQGIQGYQGPAPPKLPKIKFIADRPFLYYIRYGKTVLLAGKYDESYKDGDTMENSV